MRSGLVLLAVLLLFAAPAMARMWVDPSFEEMVREAELIAVVEVVEGGAYASKVKAVEILNGKAPADTFTVGGYNNAWWPDNAIKRESLIKGEKALMFLHRGTIYIGGRRERKEVKAWSVPTPSTGDYRIKEGKVHGSWCFVSYPNSWAGTDAKLVVGLIRGYVQHLAGKEPEAARKLLAARLTVKAVSKVTDAKTKDNEARATELRWLLCAQGAYGRNALADPVLAAARCKHTLVRLCAAEAIGSLTSSDKVLKAFELLLAYPHTLVQAAAAQSLVRGKFPKARAVDMLVKALPKSDTQATGPGSIMESLRNRSISGREAMIIALTRIETGKEAHDELLKLIRNEGLNSGVLEALSAYFLKHRSDKARDKFLELYKRCPDDAIRDFNDYLLTEKSPPALKAISRKLVNNDLISYELCREFRRFFKALPDKSPLLQRTALVALVSYPNDSGVVLECARVLVQDRSKQSQDAVADAILQGKFKYMTDTGHAVRIYARSLGHNNPRIRPFVIKAMKTFKGKKDIEAIVGACIPAACKELQDMLSNMEIRSSIGGYIDSNKTLMLCIRRAVKLKLHPPEDATQHVNAWMNLIREMAPLECCSTYLLDALVAATGKDLKPYVIKKLRLMSKRYSSELLEGIEALGGSLSPEEAKTLKEHCDDCKSH
jgi:hypothetical protein